ncbi:hypothetical protein ABPG72_005634 [Tetrahymena utriculariae]
MKILIKNLFCILIIKLVFLYQDAFSQYLKEQFDNTQPQLFNTLDDQLQNKSINEVDQLELGQKKQLRKLQNYQNSDDDQINQETDTSIIQEELEKLKEYEVQLNQKCLVDSDCDVKQMCLQGRCQRKSVFPLNFPEIFGSLVIITILGFGQAAGIGGGTSITPILLALFLYDTKKSVALVILLVFSSSLGNTIYISRERTHDGVPVIEYRLILVTLPTLIVGTVYGVAINKFLPSIAVCILLVILLAQQIQKSYLRYKNMRNNELKLISNSSLLNSQDKVIDDEQKKSQINTSQYIQYWQETNQMIPLLDITATDQLDSKLAQKQELQMLVKEEYDLYPKKAITQICAVSLFVIIFSLLRGGSKFDSLLGIQACGFIYQIMNLIIAATFFYWIIHIMKEYNQTETKKENLGYDFPQGKLTLEAMREYAKTGLIAGFLGGMLGIGGGIILIPRWLEYGLSSTRTTACTLTIICFTTFNSFFQFYLSGVYTIGEIFFFSFIAFLSSFICKAVKNYVKITKKESILVLILTIFMILASTLLSGIVIYHAVENFEDSTKFGRFC